MLHRVRNAGRRERLPSMRISSKGLRDGPVLPMFCDTVYLSHVHLNPVRTHRPRQAGGRIFTVNLPPARASVRHSDHPCRLSETAPELPISKPCRSRREHRAGRRFRHRFRPRRPAEQLDREIRVRIRHHVRPGDTRGSGPSGPAPVTGYFDISSPATNRRASGGSRC